MHLAEIGHRGAPLKFLRGEFMDGREHRCHGHVHPDVNRTQLAFHPLGRGVDESTDVGPLIDDSQRGKVADLVTDAIGRGATAVVGGQARDGAGYFYNPTVLTDIPDDAKLLTEEIFGPVAPVKGFADEDEAIAAANDTEYGLVAYVFTNDLKRALRVCEKLQTGMIGLNQGIVSNAQAPFGGVKQSGFGREGGYEGIEEYLDTKYVAVNL